MLNCLDSVRIRVMTIHLYQLHRPERSTANSSRSKGIYIAKKNAPHLRLIHSHTRQGRVDRSATTRVYALGHRGLQEATQPIASHGQRLAAQLQALN
jgi:hypothetical protein